MPGSVLANASHLPIVPMAPEPSSAPSGPQRRSTPDGREAAAADEGDADSQPPSGPAGGRSFRLWHGAVLLLAVAVVGLALYGLWPTLTGEAGDQAAAEEAEAPSSEAQIEAVVARRRDFPLRAEASGHLRPWRRATLHAEASGQVEELTVEEGARVEEGALLARLESREEQIALREARAKLLKARAEYQAKYGGEGNLTASADSALVPANPDRQATQAAASGLTAARQATQRARLELERTRITAPFAGRVADLKGGGREGSGGPTGLSEGQYVASGQEICTLLQDRRMKVEAEVLESDFAQVREGATARVHVPALGPRSDASAVFEGEVRAVNPQVDPNAGTGRVTVSIPNPEGRLVSGLYANVWLETERLEGRLVVPENAVLVRQGRDLVFVVEDGQAQWTYVEVGARSGERVEITKGVQPGDTVAVDGHFALAHDAPVEVTEVRSPVP